MASKISPQKSLEDYDFFEIKLDKVALSIVLQCVKQETNNMEFVV